MVTVHVKAPALLVAVALRGTWWAASCTCQRAGAAWRRPQRCAAAPNVPEVLGIQVAGRLHSSAGCQCTGSARQKKHCWWWWWSLFWRALCTLQDVALYRSRPVLEHEPEQEPVALPGSLVAFTRNGALQGVAYRRVFRVYSLGFWAAWWPPTRNGALQGVAYRRVFRFYSLGF